MVFKDCLNMYLEKLGCTARELSDVSDVSPAVLSRYRSGERVPGAESAQLTALAKGIAILSGHKGPSPFSEEEVYLAMLQSITGIRIDYSAFLMNLHALLAALSIGNNELARALNLDPSYISRILSQKRRPADIPSFIAMISSYIARRYNSKNDILIIADLTDRNTEEFRSGKSYADVLAEWLGTGTRMRVNNVSKFLQALDRYVEQPNEGTEEEEESSRTFLEAFPEKRMYRGFQGMYQAETDFLRMASVQEAPGKVIVYSDWPMEKMQADEELRKNRLNNLRAIVRNGGTIYVIHNIHRPFREIMESLEYWIPFYMTGRVFPYYLKMPQGDPFLRIQGICGDLAFAGTGISGHEKEGRIFVSKNKEDVDYCREELNWLLKSSFPLMEIFVPGREEFYTGIWKETLEKPGKRTVEMCSLPIFTISDSLLTSMMDRLAIRGKEREEVFSYVRFMKETAGRSIDQSVFQLIVPDPDENAFSRGHYVLSLAGLLKGREYPYTYEEYREHLRLTEEQERSTRGLIVSWVSTPVYRNLNLIFHEEHCLLITRNSSPGINIFMQAPGILQAFENFTLKIEHTGQTE